MPDLESIIPIVYGHLGSRPIGIVKQEGGKIVFKFNDKAKLSPDDINTMNKSFAPTYQVSKVVDGLVKEVELIALRVVDPKEK